MQTIETRLIDRTGWPKGPWDLEPDKVQWQDEATGLPCLIVRAHSGAWCGYVGVPNGHPAFKSRYQDVGVDVHGCLTYSDSCDPDGNICHDVEEGEDDNVWWLGFDCAHSGDLAPAYDFTRRGTYRGIDYVRDEVASLAGQLAEQGP